MELDHLGSLSWSETVGHLQVLSSSEHMDWAQVVCLGGGEQKLDP